MRKFFIVKGKPGRLVGDPARPHGFIGQRPIARVPDKNGKVPPLAQKPGDRFEPCLAVLPKHRETRKPLLRGSLEVIRAFEAEDFKAALKELHQSKEMAEEMAADKQAAENAKTKAKADASKDKAAAEKAKAEADAAKAQKERAAAGVAKAKADAEKAKAKADAAAANELKGNDK